MAGLILDLRASVWRMAPRQGGGGYVEQAVYNAIHCAVVPVTSLDAQQPFAYESTHIIWVPRWLVLRKEDQLRYGRRLPDTAGNVLPWTYVLNGRRRFTQGVPQIAWYAKEKD